jgi:hypothetical protein
MKKLFFSGQKPLIQRVDWENNPCKRYLFALDTTLIAGAIHIISLFIYIQAILLFLLKFC